MRCLSRLFLPSDSSCKSSATQLSRLQIFHLSSLSKSSNFSQSKKIPQTHLKGQQEANGFGSLFNEIIEILGADNIIPDKTPSGFSISKETHVLDTETREEFLSRTQSVCGNADDNLWQEKQDVLVLKNAQLGNLDEVDVSPQVHKITGIIMAENGVNAMEERLEKTGFCFDLDIVEKVLKRCFKVPHLGLRFLNWVKQREGLCPTTGIYNIVLNMAGETKEFVLVEKILEEMEKKSCEKDTKTWTILIKQYGNANLIGKALSVFDKMAKDGCEPDELAYRTMIRSLCNAKKGEIALEFYKEMVQKEMGLDLSLYKLLMNCIAEVGDIEALHSVADDMVKVAQIPEHQVFSSLLKSFCLSGKIREALELIRDLKNKNLTLDAEHIGTLVNGLCRAGRICDALEIVEIMKRKGLIDGRIYGIVINGYLKSHDLPNALALFQSIKESGYLPTTSTYTQLMQCLFRSNEYQKGCELYNEMFERGPEPDIVAITAMVAGHVRENRMSEAWHVFKSMEGKGIRPTRKAYSVFIKELCRVSRTDEIFKVLYEMQASKTVIGDDVFNWVRSCMEKKGEMDNAEKAKLMQRISELQFQDEVSSKACSGKEVHVDSNHDQSEPEHVSKAYNEHDLQEICKLLSSATDWCSIEKALEKCTVGFTPELVADILRNCNIHGNAALNFFSWVGRRACYRHTTETYNMAIKLAGRGKDFKHMRNLFFEMRRKGCLITPDTWAIMIMQYGRTGLTEIALTIFEDMKVSGFMPTSSTYKYLIISLCGKKGRKVDEAIKLFEEMIRGGLIPDKELLETYLSCLCEADRLQEARRYIDSLRELGFSVPLSYSMYIRALCRAGKLEEALALLDEVKTERSTLDEFVYGSIVHRLLERGHLEEALSKVESMKQSGINPTVHVYTSLIVYFFKEKKIEKALEIFDQMKQEGCEPTVVTYSALICGYMKMGKVADAWNVFNHLNERGPSPDFRTYSMFMSCLCKAGRSEEALRLISEMLKNGICPSTVNFRTVFYGLNREGKRELAANVLQQKFALMKRRKFLA